MTLRSVEFGYGPGQPVVCDVSATLGAGRITAVIGPNAAGKTTLVKLMLGQLVPWRGRVQLEQESVSAMTEPRRARRIAYVPQHGGVHFAFSVRQVIEMGRFAHGDRAGVDEAIARCDLADLADRAFVELSGGQQQRVILARAMAQLHRRAHGPASAGPARVLLADEPASAMDLRHQLRTMRLLRELAGQGVAVLIVLHDLNLAARYADDVWLMHEGRLATGGTWSSVLRPQVLEPVYGVELRTIGQTRGGRPVLAVEEPGTMTAGAEQ